MRVYRLCRDVSSDGSRISCAYVGFMCPMGLDGNPTYAHAVVGVIKRVTRVCKSESRISRKTHQAIFMRSYGFIILNYHVHIERR